MPLRNLSNTIHRELAAEELLSRRDINTVLSEDEVLQRHDDDDSTHQISLCSNKSGLGLSRTKSVFSLQTASTDGSVCSKSLYVTSISPSSSLVSLLQEEPEETNTDKWFGGDVRRVTGGSPDTPNFDSREIRIAIEPHIAKARLRREKCRRGTQSHTGKAISSSIRVPYSCLRSERPFLFNEHTYPLHQILADTLGVEDLSLLHKHALQDKRKLLDPLLNTKGRYHFHAYYNHFVTSFCIPLLHSMGLTEKIFVSSSSSPKCVSDSITYRYQAFPSLRIVRPGEFFVSPHCDMAYGHSVGDLNFHIPLTATYGTNALYTESRPGREDWHPLKTSSPGLGYLFDGGRCLHFSLENTTDRTMVSLDFRIAIYREGHAEGEESILDQLCTPEMLEDQYSASGPGYYEEATVELGTNLSPFLPGPVVRRKGGFRLWAPDARVGFPFT